MSSLKERIETDDLRALCNLTLFYIRNEIKSNVKIEVEGNFMITRLKTPYLLTQSEVSKILKMNLRETQRFILKEAQQGNLKATLLGEELRVDAESLNKLLQQRLNQPPNGIGR